jgi:hypothetical protein
MAISIPVHDVAFIERRSIPEPNSGCWLWLGACDTWGYGVTNITPPPGRKRARDLAHRLSYKAHKGAIPEGAFVRHRCDNPKCVNPDHLDAGTPRDNSADMVRRMRSCFGARNGQAKLTDENILAIKEALLAGQKVKDVAAKFGVTDFRIYQIRRGEGWRHVG